MSKDNGEEFLQELFEEELICNIIPQRPRSRTKAMMKRKNKAHAEEHVEKKNIINVKHLLYRYVDVME